MEVVAVDDGSDPPVHLPAQLARIIRVEDARGGGAARNLGARHSAGEVLVFLDDDMFPRPSMWGRLLGLIDDDTHIWAAPRISLDADEPSLEHSRSEKVLRVEHLPAGCLVTRRSSFEALGGFREGFGTLVDYELTTRARHAGHRLLIDPNAVAIHLDSRTAFRDNALRMSNWIQETPTVWATTHEPGEELDSWISGTYCPTLLPRSKALRVFAVPLRPTWAWKIFVRCLPEHQPGLQLARVLNSLVHARAAQAGLRRLSPANRKLLRGACRAGSARSWIIDELETPHQTAGAVTDRARRAPAP